MPFSFPSDGADAGQRHAGFADYGDLATHTTPITATAGVPTKLTNDGTSPTTLRTYLPLGVTDIWDTGTQLFDFTELSLGDELSIRLDIDVTTSAPNQAVSASMIFDVGGAGEFPIQFINEITIKATGTYKLIGNVGFYMGNTNTLNGDAEFRILSDASLDVEVQGWYASIRRRH